MPQKEGLVEESDVTIVAFLGLSGSGLSSFIDCAAGIEPGKNTGHRLSSHTKRIKAIRVPHPISRRTHILVDTPGFIDGGSDDAVLKLAEWLRNTYSAQAKLSGIIYMHRISDNRMAYSPLTSLSKLKGMCRQDLGSSTVLVTTMWSLVKRETGTLRKSELEKNKWKSMIDQGSEVIEFKDTAESAWEIIDRVVGKSLESRSAPGPKPPGIQKSRSLGALLGRNDIYQERGKGYADHGSEQILAVAKTKRNWKERLVNWIKI